MNQTTWLELHLIPGNGITAQTLTLAHQQATGQSLTFVDHPAHALTTVNLATALADMSENWLDVALTMRRGGATPEATLEVLRAVQRPPRSWTSQDFMLAGAQLLLGDELVTAPIEVMGIMRTPAQIAWKLSRGEWPSYVRFKDGNVRNLSPDNLENARRIRRVAQHLPVGITYDARVGRYRVRRQGRSLGYYWTLADACAAVAAATHAA